ncbi:MAG: hypothetical protein J7513_07090 [Solirubrobacteraceae bacterium]|nr:hypothetical protein [Solirubrobacteraceae bacterium]
MTFVPPPASGPLRPLDLAQPKDIGALLTSSWRIWRARPTVFLLTALAVAVIPIALSRILTVFVVDDFMTDVTNALDQSTRNTESIPSDWLPGISWSDAQWPLIATGIELLVTGLLVPALVTATHARAVTALAQGDDIGGREALRRGLQVFAAAVWVILIYGVLMIIGFVFFFIPGLWISVGAVFATTVVALSVASGFGAIRESLRVVRAVGWWRTFGAVVVITLVGYVMALIPVAVIDALIGADGTADAVKVGGAVVEGFIQAAFLSWVALALTLLFFSHKARIGESYVPPPGSAPIDLPGPSGVAPSGQWGQGQPGAGQQWGQGQPGAGQQWGQGQPGPGQQPDQPGAPAQGQQGGGYQGGWGSSSSGQPGGTWSGGQGGQSAGPFGVPPSPPPGSGPFGVPPSPPPGTGPIFHRPGRQPAGWQQGQPPAGWQQTPEGGWQQQPQGEQPPTDDAPTEPGPEQPPGQQPPADDK